VVEGLEQIVGREMVTAREVARSLLPPIPDAGATPTSKYEREKAERRARRLARFERLQALLKEESLDAEPSLSGRKMTRKEQMAAAGISETTLYRWQRLTSFPERKPLPRRDRLIDPFIPYLQRRWQEGCHNGAQLGRELTQQGAGLHRHVHSGERLPARLAPGAAPTPRAGAATDALATATDVVAGTVSTASTSSTAGCLWKSPRSAAACLRRTD
jgi:hypothetical protein